MLPKPPHVYYRGCGQNKDIENENIKLKKIQENTPLLYHHNTPKTRNQQRKIENAHLNESAYYLDKFLQEKIVEILQLRAFGSQIPVTTVGFESQIFCIRSSYLTQLHRMHEIRSSNPPVVTVSCDPNKKSRARHHRKRKLFF